MMIRMKSFLISHWIINSALSIFGFLFSVYGVLEFIGFGDGGKLPLQDLNIIIIGLFLFLLGAIGLYNLKTHFKKVTTSRIYICMMVFLAATISIIGCVSMYKNSNLSIYWIIIFCALWYCPITSYLLHSTFTVKQRN